MILDFSFILVAALFVTGVIWGIDSWFFKPKRPAPLAKEGEVPPSNEPVVVEYARSFFPIILVVVIIRSFLLEPFRIPSDSMMPGLLNGDFIFVNKYAYGLRLPVLNAKIVDIGEPKRGEVIVFRLPSDPAVNYIKRLVGLPGDHVVVRDNRLYINGQLQPIELTSYYSDNDRYVNARLGVEQLGDVKHTVMFTQDQYYTDYETRVPEGHYFFMGDNRNNSQDSRFSQVGFVPEKNMVGRAVRIWMNFRPWNAPIWSRIGTKIE